MMANVNASYYPNLDVNTPISVMQQVAWATRKNSPQLQDAINNWLAEVKREATFMVIYNRYFKSPRTSLLRMQSDYSSIGGNKLSPFDSLLKKGAAELGWDWRLLAALVYQESHFLPKGESWAGARGLMQLMPGTAKRFGATNLDDPRQSIHAGVGYLKYLDSYWSKRVIDPNERLKFVLASYNAGLSHITDARRLAEKHGKDPYLWEGNVEYFLTLKSDPKFYRDPVVVAGYCKCEEPVNYVRDILDRYDEYKIHIAS
jgi:membrane-bound lytic murein transglycosylase F